MFDVNFASSIYGSTAVRSQESTFTTFRPARTILASRTCRPSLDHFDASNPIGCRYNRKPVVHGLIMRILQHARVCVDRIRNAFRRQASSVATIDPQLPQQEWRDVAHLIMASKWFLVDRMEDMTPPPEEFACPLCNYRAKRTTFPLYESHCRFGGGRLHRYGCPDCGVIFGPHKMFQLSEDELAEEYRWLYRYHQTATSVDDELRTFYHLAPRRDGVYLNFGSGEAGVSSVAKLRRDGWDVYGFEPFSDKCCDYVIRDWDHLRSLRFDGIMSNNVMEHLTDPIATFRLWSSLLRDSTSTMAHSTPCYDYRYPFTRFHLFFYTGRALEIISERSGFACHKAQQDREYICYRFDAANACRALTYAA